MGISEQRAVASRPGHCGMLSAMDIDATAIPALLPSGAGHQFAFLGDCCAGVPGHPFGENLARVASSLRRLEPQPEFLLFLGDHIMGSYDTEHDVRGQWDYWFGTEMAWLEESRMPVYHTTSNHNTRDKASEEVWREVIPDIPPNGPPDQRGLCYWVRRGDLLLVVVNTSFSGLGGRGHVESEWLDEVLAAHRDAAYKLVAGHHPVHAVNGYDEQPRWCIVEEEARPFWTTLVRHGVIAYLCSHIIAFDVQEHQGVAQICSGGAGTNYGPGGFMGEGEYHHFVQAALDGHGFRLQSVDDTGRVRETYSHPLGGSTPPLGR